MVVRPLLVASSLLALTSMVPAARADRWFVDVEPVAVHASAEAPPLTSMFVVSAGRHTAGGATVGYAGVGAGLLSLQARVGVVVPVRGAWVARVELRPELSIPCAEPALLGGLGLGYRLARDGTPVTVIGAVESGPGWARVMCGPDVPLGPTHATWFTGGTLSIAVGL